MTVQKTIDNRRARSVVSKDSPMPALMVEPVFLLARSSVDFRHCIKAFGHEPVLAEASPLGVVSHKGGSSETAKLIPKWLNSSIAQ